MSKHSILAVIGKGFGDEGKGLAVDHFCSRSENTLVIKHNGGAQAGHTVEPEGKRFVFHQLSAGSFHSADTFWADSYYPDLYKLDEEMEEFCRLSGMRPKVISDKDTHVTIIDDILINMIIEKCRDDARHGSCGMGINECDLRTRAGYGIKVSDLLSSSASEIIKRINDIRGDYGIRRLRELGIASLVPTAPDLIELRDMLGDPNVVRNHVEEMMRNAEKHVTICEDTGKELRSREQLVFENGQGLLLDSENEEYAPHVTASRTGLQNPCRILKEHGLELNEAVYVTRSYVTRHGAGHLPYECDMHDLGLSSEDETNVENPWQGRIRYARHGNREEFLKPVMKDLEENNTDGVKTSLFLTHLNVTDGMIRMEGGDEEVHEFISEAKVKEVFDSFYLSDSRNGSPDKVKYY
ncbi:MAG: adenylosuccinate synthetase [Lachnospiraceae bacterium]|nr:adenylosuccinate synthetase [Lachnospiraceae bacterium]